MSGTLHIRPRGQVYGQAGASLYDAAAWAGASQAGVSAGALGERMTGTLLDRLCLEPGGPTVIHDVRIPLGDMRANIDHVLLAGNRVLLIDSKVWRPGIYWTFAGRTFRGLERFRTPNRGGGCSYPAEKKTLVAAARGIQGVIDRGGFHARLEVPVLAVWSSSHDGTFRPLHLQVPGARVVRGEQLERLVRQLVRSAGHRDPEPGLVQRLLCLANSSSVRAAL